MSVRIMAFVFEAELPEYLVYATRNGKQKRLKRATAKLVLLAFADHANDEGRAAYPSLELVARKTGLSLRAVKNTVRALVHAGILIPNGKSFRGTNDYIIDVDALVGVNPVHPQGEPGAPQGVNPVHSRGEPGSPEPSFNHPINHPLESTGAPAPNAPALKSAKHTARKTPPPPAVEVYRSRAGMFPRRALWEMLAREVGDEQDALEFWGRVVEAWVASGWNPRNLRGMLDFFRRHELPGTKKGRQKHQKPSRDGTEAFAVVEKARALWQSGDSDGAATLLAEKIFDARANPPVQAIFEARKIWRAIHEKEAA